jgi:hypothetical protein
MRGGGRFGSDYKRRLAVARTKKKQETYSSAPPKEEKPSAFNRIVDFVKTAARVQEESFYPTYGSPGAPNFLAPLGSPTFRRTGLGQSLARTEIGGRLMRSQARMGEAAGGYEGPATTVSRAFTEPSAGTIAMGALTASEFSPFKGGRIIRKMLPEREAESYAKSILREEDDITFRVDDEAAYRQIDEELKPIQATYNDLRALFDPSDVEFDYDMFTRKHPDGIIELPRSDLEGFLKDPVKGFDEAVGRYYGPRRGVEELEEKVPVRIVEWTPESQYNALSRHGQIGGPRQKKITASMRRLYGKLGYPTARRESSLNAMRRTQLDSYNEAELQRIYGGDTARYKAVEIDPETSGANWYRSAHADHLIARKRIENRVEDIVNSVSRSSSPADKRRAKELAEAYYEFQNLSTNFISLHGLENVRKSDLETGAWLKNIINTPYNKLPEDKKPIKEAYDNALEQLRQRVGDKEFKLFTSKY